MIDHFAQVRRNQKKNGWNHHLVRDLHPYPTPPNYFSPPLGTLGSLLSCAQKSKWNLPRLRTNDAIVDDLQGRWSLADFQRKFAEAKKNEADNYNIFSNGQWGESWVRYPKFAPSCPYYIPTIHGLYRVNEGIFWGNKLQKYSPRCTHSFSLNFRERQGNWCLFYASSTDNLFP